jgi:hypothetical protein
VESGGEVKEITLKQRDALSVYSMHNIDKACLHLVIHFKAIAVHAAWEAVRSPSKRVLSVE